MTFPESESGRADFYIPGEWNLCRMVMHLTNIFAESALLNPDHVLYAATIEMFKFLHTDIQKLYHDVFGNDFHDVSVLDNMMEPVAGGILQLCNVSRYSSIFPSLRVVPSQTMAVVLCISMLH